MWKIKQIFDGDFGCEELAPGEKPKVSVTLVNDYEDDGRQCQEYIRFNKSLHNFTWEQQTAPYYLEEKVSEIKKAKLWNEVREVYINKKNNNDNPNKKSRALYAETVNEVYMRI